MFRFYQHKSRRKCWSKNTTGDLSKRRLEIEISFRFISSLFLIPVAQSQQISSFDFVETNMFDCFRRIAPSSAGLANDVIPFLAREANENLASGTSRPLATSSLTHLLRVRKITIRSPKHFLLVIIECLIFTAMQNIAVRGHEESRKDIWEVPDINRGNFLE